MGIFKN